VPQQRKESPIAPEKMPTLPTKSDSSNLSNSSNSPDQESNSPMTPNPYPPKESNGPKELSPATAALNPNSPSKNKVSKSENYERALASSSFDPLFQFKEMVNELSQDPELEPGYVNWTTGPSPRESEPPFSENSASPALNVPDLNLPEISWGRTWENRTTSGGGDASQMYDEMIPESSENTTEPTSADFASKKPVRQPTTSQKAKTQKPVSKNGFFGKEVLDALSAIAELLQSRLNTK